MKNKMNLQMVSLLQFTFAVLVIMLHSSRLFQDDALHFIQKSLFSRMAVPFFIVCSTFLVREKTEKDTLYPKNYVKNYIKTYLVWSMVFIPYGLYYFSTLSLPPVLIPFGLFIALFYTGICYHLWYMPAFLTGFYLVHTVRKKLSFKWTLVIFGILFSLGSIETYSEFLKDTIALSNYDVYAAIFFTSRNGVFFTPIFICLGCLLYEYKSHPIFTQKYFLKLLISFCFLCIEGFILFPNQGIDKNFLFSLIPFTTFLFNWAIRTERFRSKSFYILKQLSIFYFFIHPIFIEFISIPSIKNRFNEAHFGWIRFFFTLIGTHFLSLVIIQIAQMRER